MSYDFRSLYNEKEYTKIGEIYDRISPIENKITTLDEFFYLMNGLYKLDRHLDALNVYKHCVQIFPYYTGLNDTMGWSVYKQYLKNPNLSGSGRFEYLKKVDYVVKRVTKGRFSPLWLIVSQAVKFIMNGTLGASPDYKKANNYLNLIPYDRLSHKEINIELNGKVSTQASNYESWFSKKTKCLEKQKEFEECIRFCDEGLSTVGTFHNNNDIWFTHRKAICLFNLGRLTESKELALSLIKSHLRHWSFFQILYDIAAAENNTEEALKYAGCCALADHSHHMRVSFYTDYATYLDQHDMSEAAMLHRQLVILIRNEHQWNLAKCEKWTISEEIRNMEKQEILCRLTKFWQEYRDLGKKFIRGAIERILPNGKSGFVADEKGSTYYFQFRNAYCQSKYLTKGTEILFLLEDRLDRCKNQIKKTAVELKLP